MIRGINFLYLLELALNRGKSFVYGEDAKRQAQSEGGKKDPSSLSPWCGPVNRMIDGIDTGDAGDFQNIKDVMDAWKKQLDYMLGTCVREFAQEIHANGSHGPLSSNPLLSALTRDCVDHLTDICHQGSRYDLWHILSEAVSNGADSMAAGAPIDLRVSLSGLEGEEGTRRIAAMIKTFIQMGGNMMTLTITSVEELRRAMEEPEKYRGLRVRMGGWSAYYTLLSKESQKVHLKRVEHGLA